MIISLLIFIGNFGRHLGLILINRESGLNKKELFLTYLKIKLMDIEGAEKQVLKELEAKNELSLIKEMVVEYHHHLDGSVDELSSFLKILEENHFGYQVNTCLRMPFEKKKFQDLLIYAYRR